MRKVWAFNAVLLAGVLGGAGACSADSSSGNGGSNSINSGVSKDKLGQDVTQSEAQAVCQAVDDYVTRKANGREFQLANCRIAGLITTAFLGAEASDAELRQLCKSVYDACVTCVDNPNTQGCESEPEPGEEDGDCSDAEVPASCTSTVGEIEACMTASVDVLLDAYASIPSCDEITAEMLADESPVDEGQDEPPPECQTVEENCPEVLIDE